MKLQKGEIHIWRYTLNEKDYDAEMENPILSDEEKLRYINFVFKKDAIKFICNRRFRRIILAKYLNCLPQEINFNTTALGKPFIENSNLFFNASYRGTFGLMAVSADSEIGIDIERIKKLNDVVSFSDYSFSQKEKQLIFKNNELNEDVLFTFWAFKESYIKATGTGLSVDISKIDLSAFLETETNILLYDGKIWTLKKLQTHSEYKATIAFEGEKLKCIEFNF